jgi:GNAT superfamily N-acetyltransferase
MAPFRIERLNKQDRRDFDCQVEPLNRYLWTQANQDQRRQFASCFVLVQSSTEQVVGYYTLSASSIAMGDLPESSADGLPRYPLVPVARVGRLAVDHRFVGQGLGSVLIYDALKRARESEVVAYALVVDVKEAAEAFYKKLGFQLLTAEPRIYFYPIPSKSSQSNS